ncbi:DNA topoisomerase III [Sporolactobacillus shoreae]|uniref:DNA topoisomerase n=1 Tax=Sporolactobacillus shoreae TaxID=1465501 RepID=A0A4Z0GHL1_9BACL|nr:DNA topoisomerase III [Sporolactobacillus shoreae]TGA96182.1 DNA topoisomerase III [Sporolactobacillus shoreae]
MAKSLVLAEKPSVAREIARVLGCRNVSKSYIEGNHYVVTWALGHLIELKMPEDYDGRYKTWRMEDLPIIPEKMEIKPIKQTSGQFRSIRQLATRKDFSELIIATDAGREGELVARWIIEKINWRKPVKRLWISSQTDRAITEGFKNLKPASDFDKLYRSAVCRSEADWLIGLNISRALTTKYNDSLSAGRVQTPTLSMILEREKRIHAFRPEPYWTIQVQVGEYTANWQRGNQTRLFDQKEAEAIARRIKSQCATVQKTETKRKTERQPLPYDLTELQRDANRHLGFSAKKTLNVLQNLYEHYKIVTYPRTDSRYLTRDIAATMPERLKAISSVYGEETRQILHRQKGKALADFVYNDSKVGDHHALIPTEEPVFINDLSIDERNLYDMIITRFLALFYPEYQYETRKAILDADGETFIIRDSVIINPGFHLITRQDKEQNSRPKASLNKGQALSISKTDILQQMTEPPARLSEADLLTQMEKFGLGTPATRADIIEKLIQSEAIERNAGGRLSTTSKGKQLIDLVNPELKSPELTSRWELELENIAKGTGNPSKFIENIREQTQQLVAEVKDSDQDYKIQNLTATKCPECGSLMKESRDRDGGRVLVCTNRSCGFRKRKDPKISNHRCPHCHKKMELHKGKAGVYFQCRNCGIVEKAEKMEKKADKRETRHLMNKMNSSNEDFGSSLADALKAALGNDTQK